MSSTIKEDKKKCSCGSPKRREQNQCDECHEVYSSNISSKERIAYFLQKTKS